MKIFKNILLVALLLSFGFLYAQRNYNGAPMFLNVNAINFTLKKSNGEGQFSNQYSWMLTGDNMDQTEEWYFPADRWHSQMLYQIFNPLCFDDDGFTNQNGQHQIIPYKCVNYAKNDFSHERRRYRPPNVIVDGVPQNQEYTWEVDPDLASDIVCEWEDIYTAFRYAGPRENVRLQ